MTLSPRSAILKPFDELFVHTLCEFYDNDHFEFAYIELTAARPTMRLRFPLFFKIVLGFIGIILFVIFASIASLMQLKPAFTADQPEFRIIPATQYLEQLIDAEKQAAKKYFQTKSGTDVQKLDFTVSLFNINADSLFQMADRKDARATVELLLLQHKRYQDILNLQKMRVAQGIHFDAFQADQEQLKYIDTLRSQIHLVRDAYLPSLTGALRKLNEGAKTAIEGYWEFLGFALVCGIVGALLLAKSLTKPIKALMAGTEKVGEGQYEIVAITSHDEIADLTNAFNLMSNKLKQLDEMRMQLMSEISHEMRTPLQVIKAGCYSIVHTKDGAPLTQRQRDAVGMIHQASNRINQFVNSFLDVAKMEAGLMKFQFESASLTEVLNPLIQEAQLIGQTRQIAINFLTDQLPPIMIDKERISQVFSNLLSNALKYTPDQGSITIQIRKTNDCGDIRTNGKGCITVDVQDTGVGIPEADLTKLFQKFYQAKNVPLVNEKGSGLGLALVKHVAEAHGGRVSVRSQVGVGSTFTIVLPG